MTNDPVNPVIPSNRTSRQSCYPVRTYIPSIPLSRRIAHPVNPVILSNRISCQSCYPVPEVIPSSRQKPKNRRFEKRSQS
jgi:hypothetical protein